MATEDEVFARFATPSARRQWLGEQLRRLLALAKSTGQLARVFLWGSFVTSKEIPNDLDVLFVMDTGFAVEGVPAQAKSSSTMSEGDSVSMPIFFGPKPLLIHRCCICGWTLTKRGRISPGVGL